MRSPLLLRYQLVLMIAASSVLCCTAGFAAEPDLLAEADQLRLRGRYAEAAEIYQSPQAGELDQVRAAFGLGRCQQLTGDWDTARKTLQAVTEKHDGAAILHAELAHVALQRGDYAEAQQRVDKAIAADEDQLLARWVGAELHRLHGRMNEARLAYEWFVDYYNAADNIDDAESLRWIGRAAAEYARWERNSEQFSFLVSELYPAAIALNEDYWPAHLEAGLLFLEKYNRPEALRHLNAALRINSNAAEAHAAKALLALQTHDLDQSSSSIDRALEIHPRLAWARQLKADVLMADFRPTEAVAELEAARRINPRDEATLGRLAAIYAVVDGVTEDPAGTRTGAVIDEAVDRNEHCGEFFMALAESLDLMRRFPAAVRYYGEARRRMPQLITVRGKLGMVYMRLGQEDEARRLLKASFEVDPFNVRVKNMLAVLDVLDGYETLETDHFLIRYDPQYDEMLARYAADYLEEEVYPQICGDLGYEPPGKSLFEVFNKARNTSGHGWFSARMVGLPYVGTVGACAGQMVAMASPNGLPQKFNWARVLRHEFVHVVNLQQTDFNIPHWFTEALAVHAEGDPRPPEWNAILVKRVRAGDLYDLDTINRGFVRPQSGEDWALAYCQAELYAEYMIARFGADAPIKLLAAYNKHQPSADAIHEAFSVSLEDFEEGYHRHLTTIVEDLSSAAPPEPLSLVDLQKEHARNGDDADVAAQLALAHLQRKAHTDARRYALQALKNQPHHQLAAYVLARLYLSIGEARRAESILTTCLNEENRGTQPPQENALALLAGLRLKAEDYAGAARWYRLGRDQYPHDVKWLKALAGVYLKSDNSERLAETLLELARLDVDDLTIRKKLTQLALERRDFAAAADWANRAIHIDVMDAQLHAWLAEACVGEGQLQRATAQYEVAIELTPGNLAWRFALADTLVQARQEDRARTVLEELLKINPEFPGADVLLESLQP